MNLEQEIVTTNDTIKKLEEKIKAVEAEFTKRIGERELIATELDKELTEKELQKWQKKEKHNDQYIVALLNEKAALRKKEEQLRDQNILLLQQGLTITDHESDGMSSSNGFTPAALHFLCHRRSHISIQICHT